MLEDYLRRVYPNMDLSAITEKKTGKGKKYDAKKDSFLPLSADEKSNICSHQLDAILQKIREVERKGQDEISEVWPLFHALELNTTWLPESRMQSARCR